MKQYVIILLSLVAIFSSCSEDETLYNASDSQILKDGEIIRERPKDNPWIPYIHPTSLNTRSAKIISLSSSDFLGYSFRCDEAPLENTSNLGYRVIDISKLSKAYPQNVKGWKNLSQTAVSFSFSNFDDYNSKSNITKKLTHDGGLKLLCFQIGHKHTYTSAFGEDIISDNNAIFGELNVILKDSCYRMDYNSNLKKAILRDYLDPEFIKNLHYLDPYEFYKEYGSVVACDYFSGGKATAIYAALLKNSSITNTVETDMAREINSSFSFGKDGSGNLGLTLGRGKNSTISTTATFKSVKMSVAALGGNFSTGFSIPQEVGNSSINLSNWISSLNNPNNHVIAEFSENGLIPITDFILESNRRELIKLFIDQKKPSFVLSEPTLLIFQYKWGNPYTLVAIIISKFGDNFTLNAFSGTKTTEDSEKFIEWINNLRTIFNIKTVSITENGYNVIPNPLVKPNKLAKEASSDPPVQYPNILDHKNNYKKFVENGILYFIDEVDKVGFSIPNNEQWINEYGLKDFLAGLKQSNLTYKGLVTQDYMINAL